MKVTVEFATGRPLEFEVDSHEMVLSLEIT